MPVFTNYECAEKLLEHPDHALTRKFGHLGYSLLLRLQSELTTIEKAVGGSLLAHSDLQGPGASGIMLSPEASVEEDHLAQKLHDKLKSYYEFLVLFVKVQSIEDPGPETLDSFKNFLRYGARVDYAHSSWSNEYDLVAPLTSHLQQDHLTKKILRAIHYMSQKKIAKPLFDALLFCFRRRLEHPTYTSQEGDVRVINLESKSLSKLGGFIMMFIIPTLIVGPMFALYAISSIWWRMAAIWVFSTLFAYMTWTLAGTTLDVIFTITAAFLAVLVVFVGSAPTGSQ